MSNVRHYGQGRLLRPSAVGGRVERVDDDQRARTTSRALPAITGAFDVSAEAESGFHLLAYAAIAQSSRTFAFASRLLPVDVRADAVTLYAYCRRADDAVDLAPALEAAARLVALRHELDLLYADARLTDPLAAACQTLVRDRQIPRVYFDELLTGIELDVRAPSFETWPELLRHCYRVAGTVGVMTCHVTGVRDERALLHAAHLGIAMQLTSICRDVFEDWQCGRLYLPAQLLARHGAGWLRSALGGPFPAHAAEATARAITALLDSADRYYASADDGLGYLSARCALAIRAARLIHGQIGVELRRRGCDPLARRAAVPDHRKLLLAARAGARSLSALRSDRSEPAPAAPNSLLDGKRVFLE